MSKTATVQDDDDVQTTIDGKRVHPKLENYLDELRGKYPDKSFPGFCPEHSEQVDRKMVLAVLQDPGNSGAQRTRVCSIAINPDPTAKRQRRMLESLSIDPAEVLFWNFFPFYDLEQTRADSDHSEKPLW